MFVELGWTMQFNNRIDLIILDWRHFDNRLTFGTFVTLVAFLESWRWSLYSHKLVDTILRGNEIRLNFLLCLMVPRRWLKWRQLYGIWMRVIARFFIVVLELLQLLAGVLYQRPSRPTGLLHILCIWFCLLDLQIASILANVRFLQLPVRTHPKVVNGRLFDDGLTNSLADRLLATRPAFHNGTIAWLVTPSGQEITERLLLCLLFANVDEFWEKFSMTLQRLKCSLLLGVDAALCQRLLLNHIAFSPIDVSEHDLGMGIFVRFGLLLLFQRKTAFLSFLIFVSSWHQVQGSFDQTAFILHLRELLYLFFY